MSNASFTAEHVELANIILLEKVTQMGETVQHFYLHETLKNVWIMKSGGSKKKIIQVAGKPHPTLPSSGK